MTWQRPSNLAQAVAAQAILGFAVASIGTCLVLLARDLDIAPTRLTWLSSGFGGGLLLVAAGGPRLLRFGSQPALRASALTMAAGAVLLAVSQGIALAGAGAAVLGLGSAGLVLVVPTLLTGPSAAVHFTRANGAASAAGISAPLILGGLDGSAINGRLGLLGVVAPLLVLAVTATRHSQRGTACDGATGGFGQSADASAPPTPTASRAQTTVCWVAVVLSVSVEFCFVVWAVARLHGAGANTANAARLSSAFPIGMAIGRLSAAPLTMRLPMVAISAAVAAAGTLLVALTTTAVPVTGGLVAAGLGVAVLYPVTLARLMSTPGLDDNHGAALGALASGTAILSGPVALAALSNVVELPLAFLITLPLLAIITILSGGHNVRPRATMGRRAGTPTARTATPRRGGPRSTIARSTPFTG